LPIDAATINYPAMPPVRRGDKVNATPLLPHFSQRSARASPAPCCPREVAAPAPSGVVIGH
jgi:hypothetical protein